MVVGACIRPRSLAAVVALWLLGAGGADLSAGEYVAGPADYRNVLARLEPGDRLRLRPGTYEHGLAVHGLRGAPTRPIVIEGPRHGHPAVFAARAGHNTISLVDAAYVTLRSLHIDGRGLGMDGVKAEARSRFAHHIVLENLRIYNLGGGQQTVGISTKSPAWNWTVRGCVILDAGTGMYFGSPWGDEAFVNGTIEQNLVRDSQGYNLQIKHLVAQPDGVPGFPGGDTRTVIRYNVFAKVRNASEGPWARPNVLIGHAPLTGAGVDSDVLVYGNVFYENPGEALLQGEGNLAVYNNLFVKRSGGYPAVAIQPHNCVPRKVEVFSNTVVAPDAGIVVRGGSPLHRQRVYANVIFAQTPIRGAHGAGNLTGGYEKRHSALRAPDEACIASLDAALRAPPAARPVSDRRPPFPDAGRDLFGRGRGNAFIGAIAAGKATALRAHAAIRRHRAAVADLCVAPVARGRETGRMALAQ